MKVCFYFCKKITKIQRNENSWKFADIWAKFSFSVFFFSEIKETCSYVFHPINAFHLLQRTIKWIPKVTKAIPSLDFQFSLPTSQDANVGAANGIADLQDHYNANPIDFIHGKVQDYENGSIYYANSNLTSQETLVIATAAKMAGYLDSYVSWCKAALQVFFTN